jgi:hypothetical protein
MQRTPRSSTELREGVVDDAERDDRRGEDPVLVVERPGLVHPLVQRVDHDLDQLGVVLHPLLDEAGERREHERPVDTELVHQLEARRRLTERRQRANGVADELAVALPLGVAAPVVLLLRAGRRHHVERGVGDVLADLAAHHDLGATIDLDVLDRLLVLLREELRERLTGLVHVVVGVEDREVERSGRHGGTPFPDAVRSFYGKHDARVMFALSLRIETSGL